MKKVLPMVITNTNLTSSSLADVDADVVTYSPSTTYALNNKVVLNDQTNASVPITIANPAALTWVGHEFVLWDPIRFTTTGVLPTGISAGLSTYYISKIVTADTFEVSATVGGVSVRTSGSQSGTHTAILQWHKVYKSLQASNLSRGPRLAGSAAWWQLQGASNRWAMFDGSVTSQSVGSSITLRIATDQYCDCLALLNIRGTSCRVVVTEPSAGPALYDVTHSLISSVWNSQSTVNVLYQVQEKLQNLLITNLPFTSTSGYIDITLTDSNTAAMCAIGALLLGRAIDIGGTEYGVTVGIQDHSTISQDTFGVYTIVPRTFSKKGSFTVFCLVSEEAMIFEMLASLRATACLYIGADVRSNTAIYGFPSDWSIVLSYPTYSVLNIECKGLT